MSLVINMKITFILIVLINCVINGNGEEVDVLLDVNNTQTDTDNNMLFETKGYPNLGDIPVLNRKIFRGGRVTIREHPYIVSVRRDCTHYVTGSLITKNVALTVAHPVYNVPINELGVVVGENYCDRGISLLTVVLVIVHQNFDPYTLLADLAMIRFYEDVVYRTFLKQIQLIPSSISIKDNAVVTGWGRCDFTGRELCLPRTSVYFPDEKMDPMLRSISFSIRPENHYCQGYERHETPLREGMLCLGVAREENSVAPCLGVPGAPLVVKAKLAGILSWGFGCGYLNDLPLVYTNIKYYESWILQNLLILKSITRKDATGLFVATKSYTLLRWLNKTRLEFQHEHVHNKDLQQTNIDWTLSHLQGIVFDIRDYMYVKMHLQKIDMINDIKTYTTENSTSGKYYNMSTIDSEAFLDNSSLNMDYYFGHFEEN